MNKFALAGLVMLVSASAQALDLRSEMPKFLNEVPKPSAEVKRFALDSITLRDVTFVFDLAVNNPYPVALPFDGMSLEFVVEGSRVFSVASKGGFTVPAKKEKTNTFTVTLAYADIIKVVRDYEHHDWLNTVIDGTLVIPVPRVPKMPGLPKDVTFKYSFNKKIPAIKPTVALQGFKVTPPTQQQIADALVRAGSQVDPGSVLGAINHVLSGQAPAALPVDLSTIDVPLSVSFTLVVSNAAKAPLAFDSLGYELDINGQRLVVGATTTIVRNGGSCLITVTNTFSTKSLSKDVIALFTNRQGTFAVTGTAALRVPAEIRKDPVPLKFKEGGSFSL
jgi:LEA14-like dessication related protein